METEYTKNCKLHKKQIQNSCATLCQAILKHGPRKGSICGKKCLGNFLECSIHKKKIEK
jgi:hypothetical protein